MTRLSLLIAAVAWAGTSSIASAQVSVQGGVLVGPNGHTLYTFDKDEADSGKSACNADCANNWPPLTESIAPAGDDYTLIMREDGMQQVAYRGKPLYYWAKDGKPGDKTGDGVKGVWHAALP